MADAAPRSCTLAGDLDGTRRLRLALAAPERFRIDGRSLREERVTRRFGPGGQYKRIEVDVGATAGLVGFRIIDRERADIDVPAIAGPRYCRVTCHIPRLADRDDQAPLQRP